MQSAAGAMGSRGTALSFASRLLVRARVRLVSMVVTAKPKRKLHARRICADFPDFTIPEEVDRFVEGVSVHEVEKLLG